jgi:predicted nucleic acid-binding protein
MSRVYFDASALVKRYATEDGTPLVNEIFRLVPAQQMVCCLLGVLEIIFILVRKRNDKRLSKRAYRQALAEFKSEVMKNSGFHKTSVDDDLLFSSADLIAKHNLNSNDCVVVRSILNLRASLPPQQNEIILCTSDNRLARAATVEGIKVFNPQTETEDTLRQLLGVDQQSSEQQ